MTRNALMFLWCSLVAAGCTAHRMESNPVAASLAREDQAARTGQSVERTDTDRLHLVLEELSAGRIRTPQDRANAALVLQHSPLEIRDGKLVSVSPDNYLLAHYLARASFQAGYEPARRLVAQTIDRYLSMTVGYQKYGTNLFNNLDTGAEEWAPIDRSTSDAERAFYGIPPLAELLRQAPERNP